MACLGFPSSYCGGRLVAIRRSSGPGYQTREKGFTRDKRDTAHKLFEMQAMTGAHSSFVVLLLEHHRPSVFPTTTTGINGAQLLLDSGHASDCCVVLSCAATGALSGTKLALLSLRTGQSTPADPILQICTNYLLAPNLRTHCHKGGLLRQSHRKHTPSDSRQEHPLPFSSCRCCPPGYGPLGEEDNRAQRTTQRRTGKLTVVRIDFLGEGHRNLLVGGHCPRYRSSACSLLLLLLHSPVRARVR